MPKFLILQSPNKGNVGTITFREDENFYKPTFYQISEQELADYTAMSQHAKNAFIAEKLEAQMGTPEQGKKKIAPIVEVVTKVEEPELVETPIVEAIEETENEVETIDLTETSEEVETVEEIAKPKSKGRPKKTK
jgi:hypothetical protein